MTASINRVTHASPVRMFAGGCSLSSWLGTIHETSGSFPCRASRKNWPEPTTSLTWPSRCTVSNPGSGFQMLGVLAASGVARQVTAPFSQSGCRPLLT